MAHSWTRLAGALIVAVPFMVISLLVNLLIDDEVRPLSQLVGFVVIVVITYIWPLYQRELLDDQGRLTRRRVVRFAVQMMAGILVGAAGVYFGLKYVFVAPEYGFLALVVLVCLVWVLVLAKFTIYPHLVRLIRRG